jgi:RNA polymerase sigma factor for flagellar operon FliA
MAEMESKQNDAQNKKASESGSAAEAEKATRTLKAPDRAAKFQRSAARPSDGDIQMQEASPYSQTVEDMAMLNLTGSSGGAAGYGTVRPEFTPEQERLLLEHLPIVRFLARRIHERLPQHVEMEDLVSAGVVGLMDAFAKFDPAKKVQFRSYAQFRIRGAILDSLRTLDWSPRELRRKGRAVEEAIRLLTANLGRAPSEAEVARELGVELEAYQQLLGELKGLEIGTLHMERNEDSGEEELAYVPGRAEDDPLFRCLHGEMHERLTEAITGLPERERLVMTLYYYEEMTMREIGLALGVVESRVSQIHASAVLHLRAALADLGRRTEKRSARPLSGAAMLSPLPNALAQRTVTRAESSASR